MGHGRAIFLTDPGLELDLVIVLGKLKDLGASLHKKWRPVSSMAGFSSIVEFDAVLFAKVVIVVVMTTENSLYITHLFESSIKPGIDREAANVFVLTSFNAHGF